MDQTEFLGNPDQLEVLVHRDLLVELDQLDLQDQSDLLDQMDQLEIQAKLVFLVLVAHQDHRVPQELGVSQVRVDHQETPVLLDHPAIKDYLDQLETRDHQELKDQLGCLAQVDPEELLDHPDLQDFLDRPVRKDQVVMVDQEGIQDQEVQQEQSEIQAALVLLDNLVNEEVLDHLDR